MESSDFLTNLSIERPNDIIKDAKEKKQHCKQNNVKGTRLDGMLSSCYFCWNHRKMSTMGPTNAKYGAGADEAINNVMSLDYPSLSINHYLSLHFRTLSQFLQSTFIYPQFHYHSLAFKNYSSILHN
jgi:hypothetical protein